MSEQIPDGYQPVEVGWQVLDPDGNVIDSGPGMMLQAVADTGSE